MRIHDKSKQSVLEGHICGMAITGLSKPKMPVAKFELPVAKYFYRLPPGGVLMVQILSTRGHLVHSLHTRGS